MTSTTRPKRVIVLGCTGSIGTSTLRVIEHLNNANPGSFEIVGLSTGRSTAKMLEQAQRHGVAHLAVANGDSPNAADARKFYSGADAARQLVEEVDADIVVAAIVGSAGLSAVAAAIERGRDIALANKETLVAAGEVIMPLARRHGVRILPVDSEHSAIFQCLQSRGAATDDDTARPMSLDHIRRIVLTASGGPFRTWTHERIAAATVEQALSHPTWTMGAKITIDSASMTNKALEIIEAHWLFGLESERIDVIVHPQSIIHSFVEFDDGSVLAQLGAPDMRTPIQYALTWPARPDGCARRLDWTTLARLDFEAPDEARFPALRLAREVIESGGTSGAIFNAANEEAVSAFLDGRIKFGRISKLAADALEHIESTSADSLEAVLAADQRAREHVRSSLNSESHSLRAASSR